MFSYQALFTIRKTPSFRKQQNFKWRIEGLPDTVSQGHTQMQHAAPFRYVLDVIFTQTK